MTTAVAPSTAALSAADRCDRCGAQAYLRVELQSGGELLFYVNGLGFQLEFAFAENFTEMFFVTDDWNARYGGTSALTGTAKKTTSACPAGLARHSDQVL